MSTTNSPSANLRVGIDVGGTFTDVVAVDAATSAVVARVKVPTTHAHPDGVAAGIVEGVKRMLESAEVDAASVSFVAHSTTQATNALLEGDVARVGIVGVTGRFDAPFVRAQVRLNPTPLAPGATFAPLVAFARAGDERDATAAVDSLLAHGCTAIAASAAFGVDDSALEDAVVACARERGVAATSGHDVASTYGLRARTRTAALNAAILPTMVKTARLTASAAAGAGIAAPLMIMRSDGGVMGAGEVERRPILTMLSGPAAGVAGALLHERVTDGIFIEVGGTSSDLSAIKRGRPQMRPARVGGHRTLLRTLDVRTLAVAGGSLLRIDATRTGASAVIAAGPRSAHIAGMTYACFAAPGDIAEAQFELLRPLERDGADCAAFVTRRGARVGLTPTCAANLLGFVPPGAFALGDAAAARIAFERAGERIGLGAEELAQTLLERAASVLAAVVAALIVDYELDARALDLVGGGGAAAALVPFLAQTMHLPHRIARDAEVISPVGVALALVRDSVERTIANPSADDVVRVRREAIERVVAAGADPSLVDVEIELDARRNLVRVTASGAAQAADSLRSMPASAEERARAAARALRVSDSEVREAACQAEFVVYAARRSVREPRWLPFVPRSAWDDACVVDASGVVRALLQRATVATFACAAVPAALERLLEDAATFGDVGRVLPGCTLVYGTRVAELGGLAEPGHVVALAREELRGLEEGTPVIVVLARRDA